MQKIVLNGSFLFFQFLDKFLILLVNFNYIYAVGDRLYGLVVRVPGYRCRSPGFDSRHYQIFWDVMGLERGPLSLVRIIEEIFQEIAAPV
jgi:hypothetical protein